MQKRFTIDERRALGSTLPQRRLGAPQWKVVGSFVRGSAVLEDVVYRKLLKSMHPVRFGLVEKRFGHTPLSSQM